MRNNNFALVDDEDFELLSSIGGWYVDRRGYAITDKIINGKRTIIDMHRLLHSPTKGFIVDHRDQNKLNNQKSNLRDATKSLNALNSKIPISNKSGYKGVSWHKQANCWRAVIKLNNKQEFLGHFKNAKEASEAYQKRLLQVVQ